MQTIYVVTNDDYDSGYARSIEGVFDSAIKAEEFRATLDCDESRVVAMPLNGELNDQAQKLYEVNFHVSGEFYVTFHADGLTSIPPDAFYCGSLFSTFVLLADNVEEAEATARRRLKYVKDNPQFYPLMNEDCVQFSKFVKIRPTYGFFSHEIILPNGAKLLDSFGKIQLDFSD